MKQFNHQQGEFLQIDSAQLYYEELGNKDKPALLILHGGLMQMEDMNPMLSFLADKYRVIGLDARGHGKSTLGNEILNYERLTLDAEAVLTHLGIQSVTVVGYSDGATTALWMAINKRVNIEKIVVIGAMWNNKELVESEDILRTVTPEMAKTLVPGDYELYQKINPQPDYDKFATAVVNMWLDSTSTGYPDEKVKDITCPTLIIRGDDDYLTYPKSLLTLKELIPKASYLNIPFADHEVFIQQPTVCKEIIVQFLDSQRK